MIKDLHKYIIYYKLQDRPSCFKQTIYCYDVFGTTGYYIGPARLYKRLLKRKILLLHSNGILAKLDYYLLQLNKLNWKFFWKRKLRKIYDPLI